MRRDVRRIAKGKRSQSKPRVINDDAENEDAPTGLVAVDTFCESAHVLNDDDIAPGRGDPRSRAAFIALGLDT